MREQRHSNSPFIYETGSNRICGLKQPGGGTDLFVLTASQVGAPVDGVRAALAVDMVAADADLTFTARQYGAQGNFLTVAFVNPGAANHALEIFVDGNAIRIVLATGAGGAISSTAIEVAAAIAAHERANELVAVTYEGTGLGVVNATPFPAALSGGVTCTPGALHSLRLSADGKRIYRKATAQTWLALIDLADLTPTTIALPEKTPVNAVAGSGTLTVADTPHEGTTVVIGSKTYKWRAAIGAGAKAVGTLTVADVPHDTGAVTIGDTTYTFKTALSEVKATGTLTLSANATDGNSVTIGTTKYTFKETLAAAYDVKIGAAATNTIDNLIAAINKAAGEGSTYGNGTVAHPNVTAAAGAGDTMVVTAKVAGVAGNAIVTTELSGVCSWGAGTLGSGADPVANEILIGGTAEASIDNLVAAATGAAGAGTTYSTGSVAHPTCDVAKATAATVTATAKAIGFAGNAIASTVGGTSTHLSWGDVLLAGGVDAQAANDVLIGADAEAAIDNLVLAITGGAGAGTNYGTGTVAHTTVTAAKATASTMTVTAKTKGVAGNSIATTTTADHCSFGAAHLAAGVDGTVGVANETCADGSYLYHCIADNTIADANWRRITLGTAY